MTASVENITEKSDIFNDSPDPDLKQGKVVRTDSQESIFNGAEDVINAQLLMSKKKKADAEALKRAFPPPGSRSPRKSTVQSSPGSPVKRRSRPGIGNDESANKRFDPLSLFNRK